jgi:molecular chaperone GrpE (heat shock protein)
MQEMKEHKEGVQRKVADNLIAMYEDIETMKNDSYKVKVNDKEMQRLLVDINKVDKSMKGIMKQFSLEEVEPSERYYDPELHDVASYEDAKGMAKGIILRTAKRGFKYRGELIRKPRVIVTK